jgi:hypothetical protein
MKSIKPLACLVTLLLCGSPFNTAEADTVRTWTDVQGRSINARLLHTDASKTSIEIERADGVRFTLPLARLSFADQQFVQNWVPEPETLAAPTPAETPTAALAELSPANFAWLTQAGSMTARNYVNFPADQLVTVLNARLTGTRSTSAKNAIKGVRIDADAELTEINMETTTTVSLATFFKELAEQNSLQLRVDASGILVLQRVSTSAPKQKIKFLEL